MWNHQATQRSSESSAGHSWVNSGRVRRTARFIVESLERRTLLSAGDLDPTFGSGGKVLLPDHSGSVFYNVNATAVQSDDKVLLAGSAGPSLNQPSTFFLERVNADGSVDTSFGTSGIVTTSFPGIAFAKSIVIQSDGRIVLGGTDEPDGTAASGQFALARYNTDGSLDATFGTGGQVLTRIPGNEQLAQIALTPSGQVVAGGSGTFQDPAHPTDRDYSVPVFDIGRYNLNGTLDTGFNGTGYVYRQSPGSVVENFNTVALTVQHDGKILLGSDFEEDFAVWRFNLDGTLDTSFALGGMALTPFPFFDDGDGYTAASVSQIAVQPNGQIVVGGPLNYGNEFTKWAISRFNADGSVDTTFGSQGVVIPSMIFGPFGAGDSFGGFLPEADGKIAFGGVDQVYAASGPFIVGRLLPDGSADAAFHSYDINYFTGPADTNEGYTGATALAPDGSIIVAGNLNNGQNHLSSSYQSGLVVFRLQGDNPPAAPAVSTSPVPSAVSLLQGNLDPSFGFQGRTLFNDPSPVELPDAQTPRIKATAVLPNGKILVAGSIGTVADNGQGQFYLERLNSGGTIDTTFGTGGIATTSIGPNAFATSMLVLPDGKIIVGGATDDSATAPTNVDFALARYNANGSLDRTFGSNGVVITDFPGNEEVDSLALGPKGEIVAAGSYFLSPNVGFDVARYDANGKLDKKFNGTGMLSYNLGPTGANSFPAAVAVQSDSKILVGSHMNGEFALYRFNSNGSIDASFGNSGVATTAGTLPLNLGGGTPTGAIQGSVTKLAIQPDGKIVAAGQTGLATVPFALVRFSPNGSVNRSFGTNGATIITDPNFDFQPAAFPLSALLLQPNGDIVVVGNEQSPYGVGFFTPPPGPALLIRRLLPDGSPDPSFQNDQDPAFIPPPPARGPFAEAAALTPDGNIIVADDVWADSSANSVHWLGAAEFVSNATPTHPHPHHAGVLKHARKHPAP